MTDQNVLQEFWYGLEDKQRVDILQNCHEEYDKFLLGKPFDQEFVKSCFKICNEKFIKCASKGNLELVKIYIQLGADIHARYDWALRYAAEKGHLNVVMYLVRLGADIHAIDNYALRWASNYCHTEVVAYLKSLS